MDRNGVWRFLEGSGRQGRMQRYCFNVIYGAPATSKVKGLRWDEIKTSVLNLLFQYNWIHNLFTIHMVINEKSKIFDTIMWSLHWTWTFVMLLNFLRGPKRTHSVLPRCKNNLLSTSQFEHGSITLESVYDMTSWFLWANIIALSSAYKISLQSALTLVIISFT